jgi:Winged helix DNA-binding domain
VLVDVETDSGAELDRLLDRLQAEALNDRFGSVVWAPFELIDAVAARVWHDRIAHSSDPPEMQRISDVVVAAARTPARLRDVRREQGAGRIQQLREEVGRIASILASISDDDVAPIPPRASTHEGGPALEAGQVRAIIRARRLREQYFSADLFADPAWDMLLDLMAARLERRQVAVSSLCIAAAVPATTALRWIKTMSDHGLFVRAADPQDGRRVYIELSDEAAEGLEAYLRAAQRISPLAV